MSSFVHVSFIFPILLVTLYFIAIKYNYKAIIIGN